MHVIGTAGHVDHGKSTLIKALTGIDPDRLREEKERQMTIDLGFAWLDLPSGEEIGIVDVPGHRDFIDNMLAGAGGIDAVLFIIAADEGIMPQSREHLAILKLLEIKAGVVVLTKIDLVEDNDWLDLVKADIRQFTQNSFLANAPIFEISSVNGEGFSDLLDGIDEMIKQCEPKKDIGKARLPIDRVFSIKGFGTVVTGTMLDGVFSVGQQVEILPSKREARIRGLQSHKVKIEKTGLGSRTAINLTGLNVNEIQRGEVVAEGGKYSPTNRIDVRFVMITDSSGKVKHNDEVKIFSGTAQTLARVRLIEKQQILPGEMGWLQMELAEDLVVAKGDRFIIRRPSPGETIGGGIVLDPHPNKRHKRFSQQVIKHFQMIETGSLKDQILSILFEKHTTSIIDLARLVGAENNLLLDEVSGMVGKEVIIIDKTRQELVETDFITTKLEWEEKSRIILDAIRVFHQQFPLRAGINKNELKEKLKWNADLINKFIEGLLIRNLIDQQSGILRLPNHHIQFSEEMKIQVESILHQFHSSPFSPPPLSEIKARYGEDLISVMISRGMILVTSDDIAFRKEDFEKMGKKLVEIVSKDGGITLSQFRDFFNTSRKYALSFLEFLDKKGVTDFDGEKRTIKNIDKLML